MLLNRFFTKHLICVIGGMCYSIYLLHYALIALVAPLTVALAAKFFPFTQSIDSHNAYVVQYWVQASLILPILIAVSAIYFILVERPCMSKDWPQRLWRWFRGRRMAVA